VRTTDDIRAIFADVAEKAPQSLDVPSHVDLAPPPRRRHWRAPALAAASVAVVAVAALAVPAALNRHHDTPAGTGRTSASPSPVRPTAPGIRYTGTALDRAIVSAQPHALVPRIGFRVDVQPGFQHIKVDRITSRYQSATIVGDHDWAEGNATGDQTGPDGAIYVFYRGAYDPPSAAKRGQPVSIEGKAGYYAKLPWMNADAAPNAVTDTLIWQYAPDAWAMVQMETPNDLATERAFAAAVRNADQPLPTIVRLTYLPAGLSVSGLTSTLPGDGVSTMTPGNAISHVIYTGTSLLLDDSTAATPTGGDSLYSALELQVMINSTVRPGDACPDGEADVVHGQRICLHHTAGGTDAVTAPMNGLSVTITVGGNHRGTYTDQQLEQIITGLKVAARPLDGRTWFDASTAVQPAR
jgi:hypothetical protein